MTSQYAWQESYIAAMLELHPDHLRERIAEARETIARRLEEIGHDDPQSAAERAALHDAQQNLRALVRTLDRQSEPR